MYNMFTNKSKQIPIHSGVMDTYNSTLERVFYSQQKINTIQSTKFTVGSTIPKGHRKFEYQQQIFVINFRLKKYP